MKVTKTRKLMTWWTFRIFFIFSARGSLGRQGGRGGRFFIEIPGGGGLPGGGGRGRGGREGVCKAFGGIRGGGLNIFFRGQNARKLMTSGHCRYLRQGGSLEESGG